MKVIDLSPHTQLQIGASAFDSPVLTAVHAYWNTRRGNRQMPARKDIQPSDLRQHLGWLFLADVLPDMEDFRYRLVGQMVGAYFGIEGTNQTLKGVFARFGKLSVDTTLYIYRKAVTSKQPLRLTGQANWDGNGLEPYETVYLPLSDDDNSVNIILSAFVFDKDTVLMNRAIAREHGTHEKVRGLN